MCGICIRSHAIYLERAKKRLSQTPVTKGSENEFGLFDDDGELQVCTCRVGRIINLKFIECIYLFNYSM